MRRDGASLDVFQSEPRIMARTAMLYFNEKRLRGSRGIVGQDCVTALGVVAAERGRRVSKLPFCDEILDEWLAQKH